MAVQYTNLPSPGILDKIEENGLSISPIVRGPATVVLGTAGTGQSQRLYTVTSTASAASSFGSTGTLIRGMYEVKSAGGANVLLYRIGATAAKLEHVGDSSGVAGYTIITARRDDDAGAIYTIYYDDSSDRMVIWNSQTGVLVYDNDATDPIDLGQVIVKGTRAVAGGPNIAGPSLGTALQSVVPGHAGCVYTAGTDGSSPSRMELYEYLYKAYKALLGQNFDYIVPMSIFLDDKNIVDGDSFSAAYLAAISGGDDYPTQDSVDDILGKLFVEEYAGDYYFFWDLDGDGVADLYPSVGSATASTKIDGTDLSAGSFHEVNFAYQLAYFCNEQSVNNKFCLGSVGTRGPESIDLPDIAAWVGKLPTYTTASDGAKTISQLAHDGTGLLGNKFMVGSYAFRGGAAYGGFILTDSEYLDGTEQVDSKGYAKDIGKYISMVAAYNRIFNGWDVTGKGYSTSLASSYVGFFSRLDEQEAPTNKVFRGVQKIFDLGPRKVDELAGAGYVFVFEKPKGLTWSDAPTAARFLSDYNRLTTVRIIKRVTAAVRAAGDGFVGRSFDSQSKKAALDNAVRSRLEKLVKGGYLRRFEMDIKQTAIQAVQGTAEVQLILVPAWELRRILVTIALAPV